MMLADSDVLIDFLRGREPGLSRMRIEIGTGRLATTAIIAFELLSGARTERERKNVETLLAALQVIPVDSAASARAAEARRALEQIGAGIGLADYLIAGVCLSRSATLLTRNRAHLERVPGLTLGMHTPG
jgi:tRNA(fMet)-specific endonuclease VapC